MLGCTCYIEINCRITVNMKLVSGVKTSMHFYKNGSQCVYPVFVHHTLPISCKL